MHASQANKEHVLLISLNEFQHSLRALNPYILISRAQSYGEAVHTLLK